MGAAGSAGSGRRTIEGQVLAAAWLLSVLVLYAVLGGWLGRAI